MKSISMKYFVNVIFCSAMFNLFWTWEPISLHSKFLINGLQIEKRSLDPTKEFSFLHNLPALQMVPDFKKRRAVFS